MAPEKPQTKAIIQVMKVLEEHFEPKPLVMAEGFHFIDKINCQQSQLQSTYVCEL